MASARFDLHDRAALHSQFVEVDRVQARLDRASESGASRAVSKGNSVVVHAPGRDASSFRDNSNPNCATGLDIGLSPTPSYSSESRLINCLFNVMSPDTIDKETKSDFPG